MPTKLKQRNCMENSTMTVFKAISGSTTVHLDSANNFQEAKRDMKLLEESETWCLKITKIKRK